MQKLLTHPLTLIICTALTIVFFISLEQSNQTVKTSITNLQALEEQNTELAAEVGALETQVAAAQTNLAKEKIIRNELLLQKEGEYVVQLPPEDMEVASEVTADEAKTPWEAWKAVLFENNYSE